jgi:hypothetical protein
MVGNDVTFIVPQLKISSLLVANQPQVFVGLSLPTSSDSTVAPMYGQEATIRPADCHLENHKYTFFGVIFFIIRGRWESILVVGLFAAFCGNLQRSAVDVVPRLIAAVGGRSVRSPNQAVFFSEESCQHPDYCGGVRRSAAECGRVRRSAAELM